jgi:hypothetical protein
VEQIFERRPWLLPLTLAVLTVIFLRPAIIPQGPDQVLNGADFPNMFYPLHQYIRQTILSGELPLWNPRSFIGHPIIGNPHAALFYPATWFMWLVGVQRGMNLVLVFHTWLAAWGMAHLARSFGASYVGSLLAGILYAMSGWAGAHYYAGHYNLLVVFAWIPWAMAAYRHALARGTWRATLPGIAILGAALLAGHPPMVLYLGIGLLTLWLYHVAQADDPLRGAWYAGRLLAITVLGGLALGAALVLPAAELTLLSARSGADLTFANQFALPPAQFIDIALPGFFGNPKNPPYYYWGADFFEEFTPYAGLLPLLAIPLAIRLRKGRYFVGLIAMGLVLSVGVEGALMPILLRWVPGFSMFRAPGRSLFFVMLGMAGLTALLVTALQTSALDARRDLLQPAVRRWLPIAAVIAFAGAIFFAGWYASASHVEPMPLRAFVVSGSLAEAGMILVGVWLVLWLWIEPEPKAQRWALLLTVILVTLDAWHVAIPIITYSEVREPAIWSGARATIPTGPDARVVAPGGSETGSQVTGHLNVAGYDPLEVETYAKLEALTDRHDPASPVNTLLGVKYLMVTSPYDKPNWELIGVTEGNIYYRRKDPFPRAWIASSIAVEPNDDAVREAIKAGKENLQAKVYLDHAVDCPTSGGTATITQYRIDDVEIKTGGAGGILTLSDQFYPGWQASLDGQPVPIYRADTVFRAVCVPAGDHTVRFEYRPMSLYAGLSLTITGWLALALWAIYQRLTRRRSARQMEQVTKARRGQS